MTGFTTEEIKNSTDKTTVMKKFNKYMSLFFKHMEPHVYGYALCSGLDAMERLLKMEDGQWKYNILRRQAEENFCKHYGVSEDVVNFYENEIIKRQNRMIIRYFDYSDYISYEQSKFVKEKLRICCLDNLRRLKIVRHLMLELTKEEAYLLVSDEERERGVAFNIDYSLEIRKLVADSLAIVKATDFKVRELSSDEESNVEVVGHKQFWKMIDEYGNLLNIRV